ncbi:MAG TPA: hypothetical protein VHC46_08095 [Thermodesulfobacteriota bacterium]|nr:hypothetical protein [Thermodesulfobacteriota bacterium]
MKIMAIAVLLAALTALRPGAAASPDAGAPLIPGSDRAEVKECGGGTAYVYPEYIVYTSKSPSYEGEDIYIYKPRAAVSDPCALAGRDSYYTVNAGEFGGANTFIGMHGGYLFMDEWPGREHKRFLVIDVSGKSLVYFDWYADPAIEKNTMRYNRVLKTSGPVKKEIPCPDAEKWEKEGKAVLYVEKMTLDLGTMSETHSDDYFCEPAPAITKRAADYTIH